MLNRWLSAFAALGILFGTLYIAGTMGLVVLGSLIALIAAAEYTLLFSPPSLWSVLFLLMSIVVYLTQVVQPEFLLPVLCMSFVLIASAGVCLFSQLDPNQIVTKMQWALVGLIYVALLPSLCVHLLFVHGWPLLIFLLVTVFFGDIFAFFFGLSFGGKKIFPQISPKKTISGSLGGLLGSILCGGIFLIYFSTLRDLPFILLICASIGAFAQLGDFFESLLKRISGKKDSGQIMPGHGGFLDRLDGVYFGSPVLFFFCAFYDLPSYF